MINPLSVLVGCPAYDGKVETGFAGGLAACAAAHLFGNIVFLNTCSSVRLARNFLAEGFLRSGYEWLVFIDADICFAVKDFQLLCGYPIIKGQPMDIVNDDATLLKGYPLISCAEYSKKMESGEPAKLGMGFCKIHRSVFEQLQALNNADGSAMLCTYTFQGRFCHDYFVDGPVQGMWFTEDNGFFQLCRLAGIIPRIERRTSLIHMGKREYPYTPAPASTLN